ARCALHEAPPRAAGAGDPPPLNAAGLDPRQLLDLLRRRGEVDSGPAAAFEHVEPIRTSRLRNRAAQLQTFVGRPAIVAAVAAAGDGESAAGVDANAAVVLSVKFVDSVMLAKIASRLQLPNLPFLADNPPASTDYVF